MMKQMWCCEGFKFSFEERYERTIFVYAEEDLSENKTNLSFWICMRSISKDQIDNLPIGGLKEIPVTISTRKPIKYCPWCGAELSKFYQKKFSHILDSSIEKEFEIIG